MVIGPNGEKMGIKKISKKLNILKINTQYITSYQQNNPHLWITLKK